MVNLLPEERLKMWEDQRNQKPQAVPSPPPCPMPATVQKKCGPSGRWAWDTPGDWARGGYKVPEKSWEKKVTRWVIYAPAAPRMPRTMSLPEPAAAESAV